MADFERQFLAAQGYAELGMHEEALAELRALPPPFAQSPEVLELELMVHMQMKVWKKALLLSQQLCRAVPDAPQGFIHAAFCLHELGRTDEAKMTLLNGPSALRQDPTFHYNMACYECVLGDFAAAQAHLERSIVLDKKFGEFAKTDPDLKGLQEGLEGAE